MDWTWKNFSEDFIWTNLTLEPGFQDIFISIAIWMELYM